MYNYQQFHSSQPQYQQQGHVNNPHPTQQFPPLPVPQHPQQPQVPMPLMMVAHQAPDPPPVPVDHYDNPVVMYNPPVADHFQPVPYYNYNQFVPYYRHDEMYQPMMVPVPVASRPPSHMQARSESEGGRPSHMMGNFKPVQTKRNLRPRINKLNHESAKRRKARDSHAVGEVSMEELYVHFQLAMRIDRPGPTQFAQIHVHDDLEAQLLDLFVHSILRLIDIFLPHEVFKRIIPELALHDETGMLRDSIFCLSSLMLHRRLPQTCDAGVPIKYYHQAIRSIRYYLSIPGIEQNDNGIIPRCLLSTILLCIYELFFVAIDSTYVKGASGILSSVLSTSKSSTLKNLPFYQTCFWAMYLCDLVLSLKYDLPSMYADQVWINLDPEYFEIYTRPSHVDLDEIDDSDEPPKQKYDRLVSDTVLSKQDTIWWLYKSLMNYSTINQFKNHVDVISQHDHEQNRPYTEWLELKAKVDEFEAYMPLHLKPTIYKPSLGSRVYPIIFFKDEATAIVALNFKLTKISLYEALLQKTNQNNYLVQQQIAKYPANYPRKVAKDIIGIMKTYDSNHIIWPINIHTIRQVAKYLSDDQETLRGLEDLVHRVLLVFHLRLDL